MKKRFLSVMIALAMLVCARPLTVRAETAEDGIAQLYFCDFETDPGAEWTFVDADGDNKRWTWVTQNPYSGSYSICSVSDRCTPDNWAISPAVVLPEDGYITLKYAVYNHHGHFPEKYRIYVGETTDIGSMVPASELLLATQKGYKQRLIDLTEFAGKTVHIAFRHNGTTDRYKMNIDDVSVEWSVEPQTGVPEDLLFGSYFESDPEDEGWVFYDANEDGYNWYWRYGEEPSEFAYDGQGFMASNSYEGGVGELTPDNWAVIGPIQLGERDNVVRFLARAGVGGYYDEVFAVYAGIYPDTGLMDVIIEQQTVTPNYSEYSASLDAYASDTVYIAIRHFECNAQHRLIVDNFEVFGKMPENVGCGDMDGNGKIEINDVIVLGRAVLGIWLLNEEQNLRADVSGDGAVDIRDVILVLRYAIGEITIFPVEK
ncbi:MAG: choice-of-anchor J domain-containing protein [Clostridia bacterium]|nr:choice-of-anchor J domain-containing protein [Clostridia bacterium]